MTLTQTFLSPPPLSHPPQIASPRLRLPPQMRLPHNTHLHSALSSWGLSIDPHDKFGLNITALCTTPPLLRVENFLTPSQCAAIIHMQSAATQESDLYLNYRVNQEITTHSTSTESAALINDLSSSSSSYSRIPLDASMRSGFRAQVPPHTPQLQPVLHRARDLFGFDEKRKFVFEEGLWVRPNARQVVVRDQTTVRYDVGEGVAPHVDGNDATLLVCLQAPEGGGRTVFPEEGVAVKPVQGAAIVYESKRGMLHFAEAVTMGRKWVLQLLIDFRIRADDI